MHNRAGIAIFLIAAFAGLALWPATARAEVTTKQVEDTLKQATRLLVGAQAPDGTWKYGKNDLGMTALAVLALKSAGYANDHPAMQRGVNILQALNKPQRHTYEYSLAAMALSAVDAKAHRRPIEKIAQWLQSHQGKDGTWNYSGKGGGDNSNTQFAILGLRAAQDAGIRIRPEVLRRSLRYFTNAQSGDGGFGYRKGSKPTGSMTCAGLSSLIILGAQLQGSAHKCGVYKEDKRVASGMNWLAHHFSVHQNPRAGQGWLYYYLYGMERVGIFSAKQYLGKHDWYREGASFLVNDRKWLQANNLPNLCFAILFLAKGKAPVAIHKVTWAGHQPSHRYDIKNLTHHVATQLERPLSWRTMRLSEPVNKLAAAPIIFLNGHGEIRLNEEQRGKLRAFIDNGGTIVGESCCGSKKFDKSFREEIEKILPGHKLKKLAANHALYYAKEKLNANQIAKIPLEGIDVSCRTSVIYSPRAISCEWDKGTNRRHPHFKIGLNIVSYVIGDEQLNGPLEEQQVVDHDKVEIQAGAFVFAQLRHAGDDNPHPMAGRTLMNNLSEITGIPVGNVTRMVGADNPNLFNFPFLYITGHHAFDLTDGGKSTERIDNLRKYLLRGGFLLIDPCCGRSEFADAASEMIEQVFGDAEYKFKPIPLEHPIYNLHYDVRQVQYKEAVRKEHPKLTEPVLHGVFYKDRLVIVFTKYNIGCGIEEHTSPTCKGYSYQDAKSLALNIILFAMTYN